MAAPQGILIAVEGIDGAGKTTQVRLLQDALAKTGADLVCSREPTGGKWGRMIRESATSGRLSLEDELHAFIEDRKEHTAQVIGPALDRGAIVLLDRYYFSTIAYQGSRGADVEELSARMRGLFRRPNAVLLIDADPRVTLERIRHSRGDIPNEFERVDSLTAVRAIFLKLAAADKTIHVMNGEQPIEALHQEIVELLFGGVLRNLRCAEADSSIEEDRSET